MKSLSSIVPSALLAISIALAVGCAKPPDTPESARITEIDTEVKEIDKKLAANPTDDEADRLRDRRMEILAEHSNIMQKADKNRQ